MTDVAPPDFGVVPADDVAVLSGTDFFPALSLATFRANYRVIDTNDAPIVDLLQMAVVHIDRELNQWVCEQTRKGYYALENVPGADLLYCYSTATYYMAKAMMLEDYRNYDTTNSGHDSADDMQAMAESYRSRSNALLRALMGLPPISVDLI